MLPTVLCFSGLDPSGGAGLIADVEAVGHFGAHAAVACTALTEQDSAQVYGFHAVEAPFVHAQAQRVLQDLPIKAFKTGMLGSLPVIDTVTQLTQEHPHIPLVVDPVLVANSGGSLMQAAKPSELRAAMLKLIGSATLVTPNLPELYELTQESDPVTAGKKLLETGVQYVLVKGGHLLKNHSSTAQAPVHLIQNTLIGHSEQGAKVLSELYLKRINAEFHGSGCTLASALAGLLATNHSVEEANLKATLWLQHTLKQACPRPNSQRMPRRR